MNELVQVRHHASYQGVKLILDEIDEAVELYNAELLDGEARMEREEYIQILRDKGALPVA